MKHMKLVLVGLLLSSASWAVTRAPDFVWRRGAFSQPGNLSASGGGLPDLGVFASEKVYSVYLDMRTTTSDQIPSWTLQYAPLRSSDEDTASIRKQETVTPPYLLVKEVPKLPIEMSRKYQRRMVIVYAIMDTQGKLDQIVVMQSPAAQLTDLIIEALNKWVFRPAELNGQPVSIKLLLGVPIFPSE